jgi:hypothetical protein
MDSQDSGACTGSMLWGILPAAWAQKRGFGPDLGIKLGIKLTQFRKGLGAVGKAVGAYPHAAH